MYLIILYILLYGARFIVARHKSLSEERPDLLNEWDYEKNDGLGIYPNKVSYGCHKKVWWLCQKNGHEWQDTISHRVDGRGCPICSNYRILVGYNDLKTTHPKLLNEWDYEKNSAIGIYPNEVTDGSNKKVYWKCVKGHEWQAVIRTRTRQGTGCPICANKRVLSGYNDLITTNPDLLNDWDYENNNELDIFPDNITGGSHKKVWWKCHVCGYEWQSTISHRTNGKGCPECAKKNRGLKRSIPKQGFSLQEHNPDLLQEWNYDKNDLLGISPHKISYSSQKKVWWKCTICGYEWKTSVSNRVGRNKTGCPRCNAQHGTSFSEQAVFYFLKMYWNKNIHNRYRVDNKIEIDIYSIDKKIGIEYDGAYWHRNKRDEDKHKEQQLVESGITLYRIIESDENRVDGNKIYYNVYKQHDYDNLSWAISRLLDKLGAGSLLIDVCAHQIKISEQYRTNVLKNSLAVSNPELAKQWHPTKNGTLTPYNFHPNSNDKVWWLCPQCGYEWKAIISNRNKGYGCPACAGRVIWKGNDLETLYPDIAKQWHPTLNEGRKPSEFRPRSGKTVFWLCPNCNHIWKERICDRVIGCGCPECAKKIRAFKLSIPKEGHSLSEKCPDLLKEWNYEKNNELGIFPDNVSYGSNKKVWWKCIKCGHEWQSTINNRSRGKNCPHCAKTLRKRKND